MISGPCNKYIPICHLIGLLNKVCYASMLLAGFFRPVPEQGQQWRPARARSTCSRCCTSARRRSPAAATVAGGLSYGSRPTLAATASRQMTIDDFCTTWSVYQGNLATFKYSQILNLFTYVYITRIITVE